MTGRRGRKCKQLLDDLKETREFWKLKEETLDRTVWGNRFGRDCGPVVIQTTGWWWWWWWWWWLHACYVCCFLSKTMYHAHEWQTANHIISRLMFVSLLRCPDVLYLRKPNVWKGFEQERIKRNVFLKQSPLQYLSIAYIYIFLLNSLLRWSYPMMPCSFIRNGTMTSVSVWSKRKVPEKWS